MAVFLQLEPRLIPRRKKKEEKNEPGHKNKERRGATSPLELGGWEKKLNDGGEAVKDGRN